MLHWLAQRAHFLWLSLFLLAALGGVHALWHAHESRLQKARTSAMLAHLPHTVLWVWERPEDLRSIDASTTGVAVLEKTVYLGSSLTVDDRRQPMILPAGVSRTAVVRIETVAGFRGDPELAQAAAGALLQTARAPGLADFEIDFDATRSQRPFYRDLIQRVRAQMPPNLPLSITALASWCSNDDWLADLPIDEAILMFFRMEPGRRQMTDAAKYRVQEPLCEGSVGVSTDEAWPPEIAGRRTYIFADEGWGRDLPLLKTTRPLGSADRSGLLNTALEKGR
jgi:hypothetical protein